MKFFSSRSFICLCLISLATIMQGQTPRIDALLRDVRTASKEKEKFDAICNLFAEHQSIYRDTLDVYAVIAKRMASTSGNVHMKAHAASLMGASYLRWGWADSALAEVTPYLSDAAPVEATGRELYFRLARIKAMSYGSKSNFRDALTVLYKVVREAEQYNDSLTVAMNMNTVASIAIARQRYGEAIKVLSNALAYSPDLEYCRSNRAAIFTNLAQAHFQLAAPDSADYYIQHALNLSRDVENLNTLATALRVQSNIATETGRFAEAETALKEMFEVRSRTNDGLGVVDDNLMLVDFYLRTNQADKAIAICLQGLKQGDIYGDQGVTYNNNTNLRLLYFEALAKCYKSTGQHDLYEQTLENIIAAKDSFYQANSARAIAELQVQYDVQKKENTIVRQKLDLTRKNFLFYGALLSMMLIAMTGVIIFKNNRRKQQVELELMQKEQRRLATEAVKNAEEAERRRIAADLHDNLGAYAASIVSIVDLIKSSYNDSHKRVIEELGHNAQSIVSQLSDTIWVLKKDALPLTAIIDRIKAFTQRLNISYSEVTIDVAEHISNDHLLPPSQSFHLFQVIKEAVTNALRHSGGNLITIIVEGHENWRITVMDNGKGMAGTVNSGEGGNGLTNMQQRAQESGCTIEWRQNHPTGTSVIIQSIVRTTE